MKAINEESVKRAMESLGAKRAHFAHVIAIKIIGRSRAITDTEKAAAVSAVRGVLGDMVRERAAKCYVYAPGSYEHGGRYVLR